MQSMGKEQENGFEIGLRERYRIPFYISIEEMKEEIINLFENPFLAVDAAEIILGREIEEKDSHIINLVTSHLTAERKFEKLLVQRDHEEHVRNLLKNGNV